MRKLCQLLIYGFVFTANLAAQTTEHYDRNRLTLYLQQQQFAEAAEYLRQFTPVSETYHNDLGYVYFMDENYAAAKDQFLQVFMHHPDNLQANIYLAALYDNEDKPDSALGCYLRLTRLQPANYRYFQQASMLFAQMTAYDSALLYGEHAFLRNKRSGRLLIQYIQLLTRQKKTESIDSLLNAFLQNDSTNEEVIAKRIDVSFKKQKADYASVIFWGERLWRDSAKLVAPFVSLAYSYLNNDSIAKCLALCQWQMDNNRATQPLLYCAALAQARNKNYIESNKLLDECLRISIQKDAVTYFNAKADNFEAMKQFSRASAYYDTSYFIFQSPLDLYYNGRLYDKYLNNKLKAKSFYKRYVDKQKAPRNNGELKIFAYIKEYLEPVSRKTE